MLLTFALLLSSPSTLAAIEVPGTWFLGGAAVQVTERMELRYYRSPELLRGFEDLHVNDYIEEVNRLNLLVSKKRISFGAQVDEVGLFSNRYILDDVLYHSNDLFTPDIDSPFPDGFVNLEKVYLRGEGTRGEWVVGDNYVSFGRGIALNLVRNTNIDIDTSLRGVRGLLRTKGFEITAVTGLTNPQQVQVDNRNLGIHPNLNSMISGLRVEKSGLGPATVGAHGVLYRFARAYDEGLFGAFSRYEESPDAFAGGLTVDAQGIAGVDFFAEGDWFDYRSPDFFGGEEPEPGYGVYASASAYPGKAVLLVEAKRYLNAERINTFAAADGYEVAVAPTLEYERVITEDSAATMNSNDVSGARVRLDYSMKGGNLVPYVSVAAFHDEDLGGLHFNQAPENVIHPVVGMQYTGEKSRLIFDAGLRNDLREDETGQDTLAHADVDVEFGAGALGSIEVTLAAIHFLWGDNPQQQDDFSEMENTLAISPTEKWTLILYQDFSDNPLILGEGNISEHVYGAGEILFKPNSATSIRAFLGSYKAGIRCAGGQCRNLPGFSGARLSFAGTF
jgi:hypothetical protein